MSDCEFDLIDDGGSEKMCVVKGDWRVRYIAVKSHFSPH